METFPIYYTGHSVQFAEIWQHTEKISLIGENVYIDLFV